MGITNKQKLYQLKTPLQVTATKERALLFRDSDSHEFVVPREVLDDLFKPLDISGVKTQIRDIINEAVEYGYATDDIAVEGSDAPKNIDALTNRVLSVLALLIEETENES